MIARYRIGLAEQPRPELVPQLRNFGEYLHGLLGGKALLNMKEIDTATECFWVEVSEKRYLGEVNAILKKGTRPHVPDSHFTLERARL